MRTKPFGPTPIAAFLLAVACTPDVSSKNEADVRKIRDALTRDGASDLEETGPISGLVSLGWDFRFVTARPAASYRDALMQALASDYTCHQERRRVFCSKALPGDYFTLLVRANPYNDKTLVKATFTMAAD